MGLQKVARDTWMNSIVQDVIRKGIIVVKLRQNGISQDEFIHSMRKRGLYVNPHKQGIYVAKENIV